MDSSSLSAPEKKLKPALSLELDTVKEAVPAGTAPMLRLTIENCGNADEKILKPQKPFDQNTYYDLVITQEGKKLDLPRMLDCPTPSPDDCFLTLKPGQKVAFQFSEYDVAVDRLPPGKYQAQIRFWQHPDQPHTTARLSPAATFSVQK